MNKPVLVVVEKGMMTKQEEIKKQIAKIASNNPNPKEVDYEIADIVLAYLHSQGVVIKVKNNTTDFIICPCGDCTAEHKLIDEWGYLCDLTCGRRTHWKSRIYGFGETVQAGYTPVEPLI